MQSVDEGEEVFFDTLDTFSPEESVGAKSYNSYADLSYQIWLDKPQSVKERRQRFLQEMGFVEVECEGPATLDEPNSMKFGRLSESSSGSTCSSESSTLSVVEDLESFREDLGCDRRDSGGEANCMVDEVDQGYVDGQVLHTGGKEVNKVSKDVFSCKKLKELWKQLTCKKSKYYSPGSSIVAKKYAEDQSSTPVKVKQNKKKYVELTSVYAGQELSAHRGSIWALKFSPDGQYLASGGEDGIVRIWRVISLDALSKTVKCKFDSCRFESNSSFKGKKLDPSSVVIPDKIFYIEDSPLQEFQGHTSDILDLAWSSSNCLLSSSEDKTVRLWRVGSDDCLGIFHHSNYVTCIQFHPLEENYFISGSIDGKVRIWGAAERRVIDWVDIRDIVTAVCYQPNGKGFVVGSFFGTCRFYKLSGSEHLLDANVHIKGRKKSNSNRITSIQFLMNDSERVMITSEDSKVRILDGHEIVRKYKGLSRSGSQMSASLTPSGQHIISVGEDSRIYVWNHDDISVQSPRTRRSIRSCEHFSFEGVSVAIPWLGGGTSAKNLCCDRSVSCLRTTCEHQLLSRSRGSDRFSLANWFSTDGLFKGNATWPEEKLPFLDLPSTEIDLPLHSKADEDSDNSLQHEGSGLCSGYPPPTWGLVIVAAGLDGTIRTFHNYGLPVRI